MAFFKAKAERKRKAEEEEDFTGTPTWAVDHHQPGDTWSTYDPNTGQVSYDPQSGAGDRDGDQLFVDRARQHGSFDQLFVPDEDLLRNRPTNAFEARNTSVLPINVNWSNIKTPYGNIQVSEDDRITQMQSDGTYQDAHRRGKPKKRYIKEFQSRYKEREQEKAVWKDKVDRWNALSEQERERKRVEARENLQILMENFQLEQVDSIPDDYDGGAFELSDLAQALDDTASDITSVASDPRVEYETASGRTSYTTDSSNTHVSGSTNTRFGSAPSRGSLSRLGHHGRQHNSRGHQHHVYRTIEASSTNGSPSTPLPSSLNTPTTFTLTYRPRVFLGTFRSHPRQTPIPRPEVDWSQFSVKVHPDYIPFEDVISAANYTNDERDAKVKRMAEKSLDKGRVVTVRLGEGITASFSEAVSDRLFGGMIQEIQFFPESRHAVICFLTPVAAAAFVRHIYNTRHNSQHEYMRLEIAATWYQESELSSRYPAQEEILRAVVYENASRVLLIKGIERTWVLHDFNEQMKCEFGLTRLIVKGRLVVPTKIYEKEKEWSSSIILELASIRDAIDLRDSINANGLPKNPYAKAEFTKDSVDSPTVMRPWCDCKYCRAQRRGEL